MTFLQGNIVAVVHSLTPSFHPYLYLSSYLIITTDGFLELYDPFPFLALTESSVKEIITIVDYAECAAYCLEASYSCLSFDIKDEAGVNITCHLAGNEFEVEDNFGDLSLMHFEIEKMPCKSIPY